MFTTRIKNIGTCDLKMSLSNLCKMNTSEVMRIRLANTKNSQIMGDRGR